MNFSDLLTGYPEFEKFIKSLNKAPLSCAGIVEPAQAHFIYEASKGKKALVVAYSDAEARRLYNDIRFFTDRAELFLSREYIFYPVDAAAHGAEHERLCALSALAGDGECVVVASLEACLSYTLPREIFEKNIIKIRAGEMFDPEELSSRLVRMGYSREEMTEGKGQFSLRGGILDIYSPNMQNPARIEFFDNEVDSVREFDAVSQRSVENIEEVKIIGCREALLSDETRQALIKKLKGEKKRLEKSGAENTDVISNEIETLEEGCIFAQTDKYASEIYSPLVSAVDYLSKDDLLFLLEPKRLSERAKSLEWEQGEIISDLYEKGVLTLKGARFWIDYRDFAKKAVTKTLVALNVLNHSTADYSYNALFNFETRTALSFHGKAEYLLDDLKKWQQREYAVVILAGGRSRGENIAGYLQDKGFPAEYMDKAGELKSGKILVCGGRLSKGFEYPEVKFILVSDGEILKTGGRKRSRDKNTQRIKSYNDLNVGDYVVHEAHGIGLYLGIKQMTVNKITKDYLKIQDQGTDILYVPVDQMDQVYKYVGGTDAKLKLNRLGGTDWSKTKAKVKSATKDIARQLISLSAAWISSKAKIR